MLSPYPSVALGVRGGKLQSVEMFAVRRAQIEKPILMTPTPEQAQAAIERLRAHIAFVKSRGSKLNECERDEELVLTLLDASARALGPTEAMLAAGRAARYETEDEGPEYGKPLDGYYIERKMWAAMLAASDLPALIAPKAEG
jgi:hypothetical protein